ncbi:MAG: histidine kinase dimerization/phospho-acceptor domain-containing protein, partial [Actinomycetota bacterium]
MKQFLRGDSDRLQRELHEERTLRAAAAREVGRLTTALDAVPTGIILADVQGKVVLRNRAAAIGGHGDVLVDEAVERLLNSAVAGRPNEQRLELFGPPPRVLLIRGIPLNGSGAIAVIDDLSERARLDAVRTDFVANISHELKTPVGALAVLAEALADSDDVVVNRQLASRMVEEAHRASRTIDDLLELSRIELGGRGEPETVSLAAV